MRSPDWERKQGQKQQTAASSVLMGVAIMPVLAMGAGLAITSFTVLRWKRLYEEHILRSQMKTQDRLLPWEAFVDRMRSIGGTCIEERFSPKGPVRFWWTQENVLVESPYRIIDWFTMQKGGAAATFVHWCHERYTSSTGTAALVDTRGVGRKVIYALWAECHSGAGIARWVETAPPDILPLSTVS